MKKFKTNVERIKYYSDLLNQGEQVINEFMDAITKLVDFKKSYDEISEYYFGDEIKDDLKSEENGLDLRNINHGILGEDYAWDFLLNYEAITDYIENIKDY